MARLNDQIGLMAAEGVAVAAQGAKSKEEAAALLQVATRPDTTRPHLTRALAQTL